MQAPGSSSDIVPLNSLEIESAWHLLSILIQQGCPPRLPDLASRSSLGQNLVEFLCRIPGSPLTITSGGFINVSDAGGEAFVDFVTRAVTLYVPRDVFRFLSLKRVSSNVSATYVRKRKAQNPSNADLLFPSSKKRSSLKHKRGEGEPRKNRGVPKLLSSSNEISRKVTFDVASPSDKEQYTVGMDTIHCCTAGLDRGHNFSALFHDLNYFEFGDIGCIGEEDTRASAHYATNSAAPHDKVIDFSYEYAALDDGLKASIMNEHALQHPKVVEHDFRPLLDGMLDKPSLMNQNLVENYLGEDCNSLSLELGLVSGIHDVHALERLNSIEKDFASLMDRVWDETAMGHISEYASLLACSKLPVAEAIAERNLLSNDDELVKLISVFDGGDQNSAALGLGMTKESAYVSELKHTTACEPCMQNNILAGSNIASNISSEEGQDKYIENFSQQKSIPNFESLTMEKELGSGEKELMKAEGLPKLLPLSNEITMKNSQEQKLLPNFESFIMQREECSGGGEPWKDEGWAKELSFSNQIPRKVNFDVQSPSVNEQHSFCMDTLDCSTVGLEQTYDLPVPLLDSSYFELRNISYMVEEDTTSTAPYNANSVISNMKVGSSNEDVSLDVGLNANVTKERAVERSNAVEPDLRPLLDGVLDQPSVMNQSLGEDCNILSVELGFVSGISEVHSHERLSMIQEKIEESLVERVCYDGIELHHVDHNDKNASMLPCINEVVIEAIDEINFHAKDDRIISGDLESNEIIVSLQSPCHRKEALIPTFASGDDVKNSAAVESATMAELDNVLEEKQRTLIDPHMKDHSASLGLQNLAESNMESNSTSSTKEQDRNVEIGLIVRQKVKDICNVNIPSKKNRVDAITMTPKNSSEQKLMPNFESFIIEEEEGSGGYGTVYRAQRKEDGRVFAVKCPHANAHSHHVNNELKMLERFGGRNFVIKYEGSFKNGDSECFVLEHVEHDRPEVLKKEIGVFELQWYGFCMFRALASLHKQGVVHRDVKPGNFLFSRNVNKGYLIDFNLASDLHQKFCRNSKRKIPSASTYPLSLLDSKSSPSFHSRKFIDHGLLENAKKEVANDAKRIQPSKSSKKKYQKDHDTFPIVERSKHGSQTADVSGLTSTKDQTSKTHADWLNQPMPSKGRKELINFVHKTMHSSQNLKPASNGPSSQRKRIAAPMSPSETGLLMVTPMPLHSGGNAVPGTGQKSKASGKAKREGPCVGTKGFRAPEVLFKSFHQGCKMDMWSAGVTLLYLMIGRAPFGGDPEQNIKEIARLRGSEELWEVAKLHNCESSFPVDLLYVGSLKSMGLREWCAKNTRRPDFLERISESLFDLVDKCLTVNPRCRISAEDALMHKFFAPCHESIRKQRMLRKVALSDPSSSNC